MLTFLKRSLGRPAEEKSSAARRLIALSMQGQPVWTPRDYVALSQEGFAQNAIVYRCVRLIAEAAASVPLKSNDKAIDALFANPCPDQDGVALFEAHYGFLLLSGNSYLELVALDGEARELYALRPDRMKVIPGKGGRPDGWQYSAGGRKVGFSRDDHSGRSPILHMRMFNPLNDYYGMSPVEAAAYAIDIHNAGARWNKALLDNAARPSGALVLNTPNGERLSEEQYERLKSELSDVHQGARNAGRPMLLEGGLEWKPMSHSPSDMEFLQSRHAAARDIALAFGVPPMLLGLPGDNTYANYQEANKAFWRQTVLPLVARTGRALQAWLRPWHGQGLQITPDQGQVPALRDTQGAAFAHIAQADFLSADEKRALAGLPAKGTAGQ